VHRCVIACTAALPAMLGHNLTHAGELSDIPFSLRLPAALARFSPYNDVAGVGGASVASKYQTSINPAAIDWEAALARPYSASAQLSGIAFQHGATVWVASEALGVKTDRWGTFQLAAAQIGNNGDIGRDKQLFEGDYAQIQWGYRSNEFAVGLNFSYTSLDTTTGQDGVIFARGHSGTYTYRGGLLGALSDRWMVGLVAEVARSPADLSIADATCACTFGIHDTAKQVVVRPGISFTYAEQSSIYIDYQYARYSNFEGAFKTNRIFAGVEHRVMTWIFARAGFAFDFRGTFSPTAGIGIYPSDAVSIDVSYQYNMYPELGPEFGKSNLLGISLSVSF